ncbi:hypothetical protein FJT64_012725 [Amphibalanus amphitrite]|uniref:Uncharacterized protein n=1 Tax=Amphibalanus amphitrite TaxID=1232801 RepID=A0A6A4VHJ3_AMPAM|nr:hypothetical protein FJT64_012725 [Amphibalanus amphitrite]
MCRWTPEPGEAVAAASRSSATVDLDLERTPSRQASETAMQDWRNAIFNPPPSASFTYKMGNSTVRLQSRLVVALGIIGGIVVLYLMLQRSSGGMTVAQTVWGKSAQTR